MRKRNPKVDTDKPDKYNQFIAISTRCMHLGCPVRFVEAAERFICPCHGGVYDFRAWSTAARRCARWTASTRACATAAVRSARATRSTSELKRFSPRDPAEPLDGIGQYLYPSRPTIRKMPGT